MKEQKDHQMPPSGESPPGATLRDRIKDFRRVPVRELLDHEGNPRRHPQAQRDALRGILEQVGIAGALTAYSSQRNGGQLTLIDGHLRKQDYSLDWPTLILDVTDEEADFLLASHDPLAALAEYDKPKLDALLQQVKVRSQAVADMLTELARKTGIGAKNQENDRSAALPSERFEIVVECESEEHQREVFDHLTGEGYTCRVLTF
jgi:hypothetical protein